MKTNPTYYLLLFGLLLLGWHANAQTFSKDAWHNGEVELFNGEVLQGKLKYDIENDNLQLTQGGTIRSFSAYQVESFHFFDEVLHVNRDFYTLPFKKVSNYEVPVFFELLTDGPLTLLNREVIAQRMVNTGVWGWGFRPMMGTVPVLEDSYYILITDKREVRKLNAQKNDVLGYMSDHEQEIADYIKTNNLNMNRRDDIIRVFNYYNSFRNAVSGSRR